MQAGSPEMQSPKHCTFHSFKL